MTSKQRRFIEEYVIDYNGTQAAIRAGYSPNTARAQSSRLLTKEDVKADVDKIKIEQQAKSELSAEWVLNKLLELARCCGTIIKVTKKDGTIVEQPVDGSVANRALELLGKYFTLFHDQLNVNVSDSIEQQMREAQERVKARDNANKGGQGDKKDAQEP